MGLRCSNEFIVHRVHPHLQEDDVAETQRSGPEAPQTERISSKFGLEPRENDGGARWRMISLVSRFPDEVVKKKRMCRPPVYPELFLD
jgi:hypothetical protein